MSIVPSTELDRLFKLLDDAAASNGPKKSTAAAESTAAAPLDSNFARFQEEVAALSLAFPPPPPPSGVLSTKAQEKTARASAASSSDSSEASTTALSYKSQPMEAKKAVADAANARSTVGAPTTASRGIRSEYAAAEATAAKTVAAATAEDEEDSDDDLLAASRAKMKSASAVASSKLQKPPAETKAIIPVLTAAARSKIAGALDAQDAAVVSEAAPSDDSDDEESSEAQSDADSDDEAHPIEAAPLTTAEEPTAEVSAVESSVTEAETVAAATVAATVVEAVPAVTATPTKAARPLIEELPSTPSSSSVPLPQETSTPTTATAAAAAAPAASGSLLSGSLLGAGAPSRAGKAKGKVVITNTRSKHAAAAASSADSGATSVASAAENTAETLPSPSKADATVAPEAPRSPVKPTDSTSPAKAATVTAAAAAATAPAVVVEPAAEAAPEEPLPAAPLHLPTSIPLDLLPQASVLPVFPWTCLAQKSTGMMIPALWASTLADRSPSGAAAGDVSGHVDDSVDSSCELQDLVAVSIYLEDTAADAEAFVLLEWLLRQVGSSMTLVGFLRGQVEEERHARPTSHLTQAGLPPHASSSVYHLAVFRKQSEDVSVHYLQQVAQVTKLVEVLPHRAAVAAAAMAQAPSSSSSSRSAASAASRVYVSDLLALYEFYDMPERVMNQLIAAHRSHLSDALPLPRGVLPGQVHVAPVVFRPNTLHDGAAVSTLIQHAEAQGLRVAGVRLLHLTPRVLAEIKKTLNLELPQALALASAGHLATVLVVAFIGVHGEPVADLLRSILGPEDPTLARKTDPQSIRALFGGQSREENVAFSLSYAKEKLWREVSYWFGPRLASQGYPVLLLPKTTTLELGLRVVQYHAVDGRDSGDARLSHMWLGDDVARMQRVVMDTLVAAVEAHGRVQHLQSLPLGDFASRMFRVKPSWVFKSEDAIGDLDTMHAAQCLLLRLETTASMAYLVSLWQRLAGELTTIVAQSQRAGATGVTAYVATSTASPGGSHAHDAVLVLPPVQPPQGSQYLAQQILTKLSVHDYRSHEDVGLSDTVVVTVPLHGGLATVATDQPVATATACRFLPLLYARLPPSSHVHLLGAVTATDGSHVALALRGYQLIETLDDVVRDMQTQFQQVLTPVATQLAQLATAAHATTHTTAATAGAAMTASTATIAVLRGRRALERILQSFPLQSLYLQPAVEDLRRLVPNSHQFIPDDLFTTQASLEQPPGDQSSHAQAKAIAHALFPPGVFTSLGVLVLPVQPLPTPPPSSSSSGAAHHALHQQETNHMLMTMRYHVAALSRLQKDEFTVLAVQATDALSLAAYERLCRENFETYVEEYRARGLTWDDVLARLRWSLLSSAPPGDASVAASVAETVLPPPPPPAAPVRIERGATAADSIGPDDVLTLSPPKPPAAPAKPPTRRVLPAPSTTRLPAALIVLVARKSALLKLRHCVGPALDDSVASEKYPRSLTALYASLFPGRLLSASGDLDASSHNAASSATTVDRYPFVLTSLSCATADWLVKKYLPAHRDVFLALQQQQPPSSSQSTAFGDDADHDASWTRDLFQAAETLFGVDAAFQSRLATVASSTAATATAPAAARASAPTRAVSVLLKQEAFAAPATAAAASPVSLMDSVDSKTVDVAGVVVTAALIAHHGLDTIFDVLHREGLVVVHSVTTKLTMAMVKTLSEAAGMSSLTLKPSNQTMLTGPVVVLGLYGPIHAFVRLKSFQVHTTRSSLLASTGGNAASVSSNAAAASLWTLPSGESGVLASSSSRLARQLFGLCFDRVLFHAKECPFVVVEDVSEAAV